MTRFLRTLAYWYRAIFRPSTVEWTVLDDMKAEVEYRLWTEEA